MHDPRPDDPPPGSDETHRRRFSRSVVEHVVRITQDGLLIGPFALHDVTMRGVAVGGPVDLLKLGPCEISIVLGPEIAIGIRGKVIRASGGTAGIDVTAVCRSDIDHFHNLVVFNAEDPDVALEELNSGRLGLEVF